MNKTNEKHKQLIEDYKAEISYLKEMESNGIKEVKNCNWSFVETEGYERIEFIILNWETRLDFLETGIIDYNEANY